jgi:23S rRNA pseudouridine1911/1915/1917 synthase
MPETRQLPVPDGLDGMRVDAGLSRLLGMSRTAVAALTDEGRVAVDGRAAVKSDRLVAGAWLEVELPGPDRPTRCGHASGCRGGGFVTPSSSPRRVHPGERR